jgi:hypothetical protein
MNGNEARTAPADAPSRELAHTLHPFTAGCIGKCSRGAVWCSRMLYSRSRGTPDPTNADKAGGWNHAQVPCETPPLEHAQRHAQPSHAPAAARRRRQLTRCRARDLNGGMREDAGTSRPPDDAPRCEGERDASTQPEANLRVPVFPVCITAPAHQRRRASAQPAMNCAERSRSAPLQRAVTLPKTYTGSPRAALENVSRGAVWCSRMLDGPSKVHQPERRPRFASAPQPSRSGARPHEPHARHRHARRRD